MLVSIAALKGDQKMKKIIFLLVATAAVGACVSNGKPIKKVIPVSDTPCVGGVKGHTDTELKYGKDDINIKWKSHVGEDTEFRIKLKPKHGYEDNKVEIIGKRGTLPGGGSTPYKWLNIEKSAKELTDLGKKPILVLCVPEDIPIGTEYKFDVDIEGIGDHDPRVAVTW